MKRKVAQLVSGNLLGMGINAAVGIVISRALGPEMRGFLAICVSCSFVFASTLNFGIPMSAPYFARAHPGSYKKLLRLINYCAIISLVLSALVLLIAPQKIWINLLGFPMDPTLMVLILFNSSSLLSNAIFGSTLVAQGDAKGFSYGANIGTAFGGLLSLSALFFFKLDPYIALFTNSLGLLLSNLLYRYWSNQAGEKHAREDKIDKLEWKEFLLYGLKSQLGSIGIMIFQRSDTFIIAWILDPKSVGLFSVGIALRDLLLLIPKAISGIYTGEMTAAHGRNDQKELSRFYRSAILGNIFSATAVVGITLIFLPWIVTLLYGKKFVDAVPVSYAILLSVFPQSLWLFFRMSLLAKNQPSAMSIANWSGAIVGLAFSTSLTYQFGLIGAGFGTLASSIVLTIANYFALHSRQKSKTD